VASSRSGTNHLRSHL
jgi:hypothetical protein